MKKFLLLLVAFATVSLTAQVIVFEDDFETETVDATTYAKWTTTDTDGDTENFEVADFTAAFATATAHPMFATGLGIDSDSWESANPNSPMQVNNYITTTNPIDLTGASGTITLSFLVGTYQNGGAFIADQYSIYFTDSNDAAVIEAGTALYNGTLADVMTADQADGSASAVTQTIDLSSFAGMSKYLTFRHHDTFDENSVLFDNIKVEADALAAVDDNVLASSVSVYPTAVDQDLTINNRSTIALNTASIFDVNGRLIAQHNLNGLVGEKTINVSNLSAGLYFVELASDNGKAVKKLVKK